MLSQLPLFGLIFVFPLLLSKPFFFPQPTKPVSEKRRSRTRSPLDRREIWVSCLKQNSEHYHRWEIWYHVGTERNTLLIVAFYFPAETQNCLGKTTIPVSLTVGFSWNLDMLFEIQLRTLPPLGFLRQYLWREKKGSHEDSISGGFNLFSVSLTFENSIGVVGGITERISGNR